jgi:sugar phosphate isomerase/epimerase
MSIPSDPARLRGVPLTRRALLARLLAAGSAAAIAPATLRAMLANGDAATDDPYAARAIGVQLYTVRTLLRGDVEGTLAALAAIGYREVEPFSWHERTPAEWATMLQKHGLAAPSMHVPLPANDEEWRATIAGARTIGARWLVIPWVPPADYRTKAAWERLADRLNALGRIAVAEGMRVGYHNHDFEFAPVVEGVAGFDVLAAALDPATCDLEVDLFWMVRGGRSPYTVIPRLRNVRLFHCKDIGPDPGYAMLDVGQGTLDWTRIAALAKRVGVRHLYVEHDSPSDPLASVRRSYGALAAATR